MKKLTKIAAAAAALCLGAALLAGCSGSNDAADNAADNGAAANPEMCIRDRPWPMCEQKWCCLWRPTIP